VEYIETIYWLKQEKIGGNRYTSNNLDHMVDSILYYSSSFQIPIYKKLPDDKYPYVDEDGRRYLKSTGGHQKKTFIRKGIDYWKVGSYNLDPFYFKQYQDEHKGHKIGNNWIDIQIISTKYDMSYPTQKPEKLLKRVICLSTK
jgi:hypothetical protein